MKVFIIMLICSMLVGCFKKTEKSDEKNSVKDTVKTSESTKKDTIKTSRPIKKDTAKTSELKTDTVTINLLSYEQRQGKYIFMKYCAVCHGEQGKGNGFNAFNLNPKPKSFTDSNYISTYSNVRLSEVINKGGRGVNKSQMMPSYKGTLNKDEIEYVTQYVRFLNNQKH
jgi:mono/diheme cytochrome c family protein